MNKLFAPRPYNKLRNPSSKFLYSIFVVFERTKKGLFTFGSYKNKIVGIFNEAIADFYGKSVGRKPPAFKVTAKRDWSRPFQQVLVITVESDHLYMLEDIAQGFQKLLQEKHGQAAKAPS